MDKTPDVFDAVAAQAGIDRNEVREVLRSFARLIATAGPSVAGSTLVGHGVDARVSVLAVSAALHAVEASSWLSGRSAPGSLPAEERRTWEAAGANFAVDDDPVGRAKERTAAAMGRLVGSCIIGDQAVARHIQTSRSRVSQRLASRTLYMFAAGSERCYPAWQFRDQRTIPGLGQVLSHVDPLAHPLTVDHWFQTPNVDLLASGVPVSPADWLASGGEPSRAASLATDL